MKVTRKSKLRAKPLDLVRRAKLLGVTPGHLSQVLSTKRVSVSLHRRYAKLLEDEGTKRKIKSTSNTK